MNNKQQNNESTIVWDIFSYLGIIITTIFTFLGSVLALGNIYISTVISILIFAALFFLVQYLVKIKKGNRNKIKRKNCFEIALNFGYIIFSIIALIFIFHYIYLFHIDKTKVDIIVKDKIENIDSLFYTYNLYIKSEEKNLKTNYKSIHNNRDSLNNVDVKLKNWVKNFNYDELHKNYLNNIKKDAFKVANNPLGNIVKINKVYDQLYNKYNYKYYNDKIMNALKSFKPKDEIVDNYKITIQDFKPHKPNPTIKEINIDKPIYSFERGDKTLLLGIWIFLSILILLPYFMAKRKKDFLISQVNKNGFCD